MQKRIWIGLAAVLVVSLVLVGCDLQNVETAVQRLNQVATQAAGGTVGDTTNGGNAPVDPNQPPAADPNQPPTVYDLPATGETLIAAWSRIYAQQPGSAFEVTATERQVSDFIIEHLRASGRQNLVFGGNVVIAGGQIRVDLALQNEEGAFGGGTVSFQPTLAGDGSVRLNALGGDLGGLRMPADFPAAVGDAVHAALTGAPNATTSRVTLRELTLDAATLHLVGNVR
ncbi:MAG: hypothetical protein GX484_03225 [Chloroflexi bacterium]|nr:hypothetical protein [Chloroflexota bacterium]